MFYIITKYYAHCQTFIYGDSYNNQCTILQRIISDASTVSGDWHLMVMVAKCINNNNCFFTKLLEYHNLLQCSSDIIESMNCTIPFY